MESRHRKGRNASDRTRYCGSEDATTIPVSAARAWAASACAAQLPGLETLRFRGQGVSVNSTMGWFGPLLASAPIPKLFRPTWRTAPFSPGCRACAGQNPGWNHA